MKTAVKRDVAFSNGTPVSLHQCFALELKNDAWKDSCTTEDGTTEDAHGSDDESGSVRSQLKLDFVCPIQDHRPRHHVSMGTNTATLKLVSEILPLLIECTWNQFFTGK